MCWGRTLVRVLALPGKQILPNTSRNLSTNAQSPGLANKEGPIHRELRMWGFYIMLLVHYTHALLLRQNGSS